MSDRLCINLATLGHLDYVPQLETSARAGWKAVGLRLNAVEAYLAEGHTVAEARKVLDDLKITAPEMNFFPDWFYARGAARTEAMERFRKLCRLSAQLGCSVIIATPICDGVEDVGVARENLAELARIAAPDGIRVALEFYAWTSLNSVRKAWEIVRAVDHPFAGICLDAFHYFRGESTVAQLREVPIEKIFVAHICDAEDCDADVATVCRQYRALPGEGVFCFDEILGYLRDRKYSGYYSLEILNKNYCRENPLELAVRARKSLETLLEDFPRCKGA